MDVKNISKSVIVEIRKIENGEAFEFKGDLYVIVHCITETINKICAIKLSDMSVQYFNRGEFVTPANINHSRSVIIYRTKCM